ncbi:uncharacterized protein TNCV_4856401 [Trichonephila clavipes]|nr:uncharacterized protein TNCV_4856401 [Trichonephila clavipes]
MNQLSYFSFSLLAIVSNYNIITLDVLDCRHDLQYLFGKTTVLQWVPAHCEFQSWKNAILKLRYGPRRRVVAEFHLDSGNECLRNHLYRIKVVLCAAVERSWTQHIFYTVLPCTRRFSLSTTGSGGKSQDLGGQFTGPKREIRRSPNVSFNKSIVGMSCVTCCADLLEPQLLDIMIVQFRNEKVSNHGSIPITIDCNVVAFIVFEEVRTNDSTSL